MLAVIVIGYVPFVPAAGVPDRRAVSGPLPTRVTPLGRAPVSVKVTFGKPVAVTVNDPVVPTSKVVLLPLVIAGTDSTSNANDCVAVLMELVAFIVSAYCPKFPEGTVPAKVAVPFPLSVKVTPPGSTPVSVIAGVGVPVVVTVNEPTVPWMKV